MTAASADPELFRGVMTRLISGVSVIAVRDGRLDLAMTATSLVSVSLEPPTVLFTVHSDARMAEAIEDGARWAVSILGPTAAAAADWLASPGRPAVDQLVRVPHRLGAISGAAILDGASAWLECETEWIKPAATHFVVTGRVLDGGIAPGVSGAILHAFGRLEVFGAPS